MASPGTLYEWIETLPEGYRLAAPDEAIEHRLLKIGLHERYADVSIIMITSRVGDKHRARAIELGVNDYLGKPYQDAQLLEAIQRQLEDKGIKLP